MQRALAVLVATAAAAGAACRLDPLVDDVPGASTTIRPSDAVVPPVSDNGELANQITLNDGLDSKLLVTTGNVIPRGMGNAGNGAPVSFWAFGTVTRAPAPMYVFGTGDPTMAFTQNSHLPLIDSVPGDVEYSPFHAIYRVRVTDKYQGEKITTTQALADAIAIGLVDPPVAIKRFINTPVVRPGTRLDLGGGSTAPPGHVYAKGYIVDDYRLGGAFAEQPNPNGLLPTSQVSFLRGPGGGAYDPMRPIFQATIPTSQPPPDMANYTALSVVVDVDVKGDPTSITKDSELFKRGPTGAITGTDMNNVLTFTVTTTQLDLQIQLPEGP